MKNRDFELKTGFHIGKSENMGIMQIIKNDSSLLPC